MIYESDDLQRNRCHGYVQAVHAEHVIRIRAPL
jgi:hypothetical protein